MVPDNSCDRYQYSEDTGDIILLCIKCKLGTSGIVLDGHIDECLPDPKCDSTIVNHNL